MDRHHSSPSPVPYTETVGGVMVNGYWFPSLAAAAQAPAGKGFDFAAAAAEAAAEAARVKRKRKRRLAQRRRLLDARYPKGIDFSCGAMRISAPPSLSLTELESASASGGTSSGGVRGAQTVGEVLPFWRPWTVALMVRTGATQRLQQAVRDYVPRMPREALMLMVGVAGSELAKREIAAQVEALEEPVRGPAWALLNETYRNLEVKGAELVQSNWDVAGLVTKELADWKRRGVGHSYQEALLKEVLQLQTRALLKPISLPAEEGSLMVQLNATYRSIEESLGRLLPEQTKGQLALLESLGRKLEDKGIGALSFDEVYRALLLGAVPPTLVSDAVRLLAAGRPGEGGGAGFLSSGEASSQVPAFYGTRDGGEDVTLASLVARLNDTRAVSRVMTYTALAAETEVIENLREVLDGLQTSIRTTLLDLESDLVKSERAAQPRGLQDAASFVHQAARSAITFTIDGFNNASSIFDATFEALAEPSRRTLLRSSQAFPWQALYKIWTNATAGDPDILLDEFTGPEGALNSGVADAIDVSSAVDGEGGVRDFSPVAVPGVHDADDDGIPVSCPADLSDSGISTSGRGYVSSHRRSREASTAVEPTGDSFRERMSSPTLGSRDDGGHAASDDGGSRKGGLARWWNSRRRRRTLLLNGQQEHAERTEGHPGQASSSAGRLGKAHVSTADDESGRAGRSGAVRKLGDEFEVLGGGVRSGGCGGMVASVGPDGLGKREGGQGDNSVAGCGSNSSNSSSGIGGFKRLRWKGDGSYRMRGWRG